MAVAPNIKIVVVDDFIDQCPEAVEDLETIQGYMHDVMEIGKIIDLEKFVNKTFADKVYG